MVGAEPRIHSVAADRPHFEERNQEWVGMGQMPGKAMVTPVHAENSGKCCLSTNDGVEHFQARVYGGSRP